VERRTCAFFYEPPFWDILFVINLGVSLYFCRSLKADLDLYGLSSELKQFHILSALLSGKTSQGGVLSPPSCLRFSFFPRHSLRGVLGI
jgi:hypothetical protein